MPRPVRHQIGLAYLLARATDTVADTQMVPPEQRLAALRQLRERILTGSGNPIDFRPLGDRQGAEGERVLLRRVEEALTVLGGCAPDDQRLIRDVLSVIISGQELDLLRFATATPQRIAAMPSDADLDDYTYRVAGCVGEFWTRLCRAHLFPNAVLDETLLLTDGVRFGKGLQLVNVLRDLPRDLEQGRCYLPADRLAALGLTPGDLLKPDHEPPLRPLYEEYLTLAESHLAAGWDYVNTLPRGQIRVRLACAWPLLIGARTVEKLRVGKVLDAQHRIKVSRAEVRGLILRSVLFYPFPSAWRGLFPRPVG